MSGDGHPRRLYMSEGKVYLIRDIWDGTRFVGCEYATLSEWTELKWTPCPEGVAFDKIEPLGEVQP